MKPFWKIARLAAISAMALGNGCFAPDEDGAPAPAIAYASPVIDTLGVAVSHNVNSSGGPVARYSVKPSLPGGLKLDSLTGKIRGTPRTLSSETTYAIVAVGPGGSDTASLVLTVVPMPPPAIAYDSLYVADEDQEVRYPVVSTGGRVTQFTISPPLPGSLYIAPDSGTLQGWGFEPLDTTRYTVIAHGPGGQDTASFRLAVRPRPTALMLNVEFGSAPGYTLQRIAITLTPDDGGAVLRDTVSATELQPPDNLNARALYKFIPLAAGSWSVLIRALDPRDSAVHEVKARVEALAAREWRTVEYEPLARFVSRVAEFSFPDSLRVLDGPVHPIRFTRLRVSVGTESFDLTPTVGAAFTIQPVLHKFRFHYLPRFTPTDLRIEYFGELQGWNPAKPLYRYTFLRLDGSYSSGTPLYPEWTGPGSAADSTRDPEAAIPQVNRPYGYLREYGESFAEPLILTVPPY